jgi:hypothetical protein
MTDDSEIETELTPLERALAEHLQATRPVPPPAFRGALNRYLVARDPGYGPRPTRLRLVASGCLAGSGVFLALAALQAAGSL